jgi:L-ascorbate 6-phosphate lactonase
MSASLMDEIRAFETPVGSVAIWWLGQSGYIFKSAAGTLAGVDLYLTDSCAALYPQMNLARRVPVLIQPEDLRIDLFACTHNHADHTDVETLRGLRAKDETTFAGPPPSCEVFRREGVDAARILTTWPDCDLRFRDIRIRGTFALPTDATDLNHMGFVFEFGGGPKVYVTGDTDACDLLYSAAKHTPDVMIAVINGGFNNLSHWEAAELAAKVKPRIAIPSHYDMFADNSADPRQFQSALKALAPEVGYRQAPGCQLLGRVRRLRPAGESFTAAPPLAEPNSRMRR